MDERERPAVARALGAVIAPCLARPRAQELSAAYVGSLALAQDEADRLISLLAGASGPLEGRVDSSSTGCAAITRHRLPFVDYVAQRTSLATAEVHARLDVELTCLAPAPPAGLFASGVAHDLRNPLGVIRTAVFLARREADLGKRNLALDKILRQVDEATQIASDLLALVREGPLDRGVLDLQATIEDLADPSTELEIPRGLHIRAHPTLLRRAIVNLLENARAFASQRHGLTVRSVSGGHEIEVWDDGGGFSNPAAAFDAFVSDRPGGTGLGLWLVAEIARRHDGHARASNHNAGGTTRTRVFMMIPQGGS